MKPSLPTLPITAALPALEAALAVHRSVVLQAPPGAGKSTIVPLYLLQSPWLAGRKILMLEPRRLATRSVALRMSRLLNEPLAASVGFRTRLESHIGPNTRIEVLTEAILTRMLQEDPALPGVGCVIFDEFHERSVNADLGLALALESQSAVREDLKIVVMSATLEAEALADLLGDAPIVSATSRSFEVTTHHLAPAGLSLEAHMAKVVRLALREQTGDILCFLPGAAEIRRVQSALHSGDLGQDTKILPLYGEMPSEAQDAALAPAPPHERKIVLATSIAETSLTIEGVRIVIDSGLRRTSEFDPVTGMSRLVTGKVSQAAADQRRGRAGRLSHGVCYRLWSEGVQATLAAQSSPEILHADLAPLALELACWGVIDAASLRWLDPPAAAPLAQARELLRRLDALDASNRITSHGRELARAGTHPRLAHMLVRSPQLSAAPLACEIAALLVERDLLRAPPAQRNADLRLRLDVLHGRLSEVPAGMSVDEHVLRQAQRNAADFKRRFAPRAPPDVDAHDTTGILLGLAYPDRIGGARGERGRYLLANGRGARFGAPQALAASPFIVAAELDGAEREALIYLAAPIRREDIERHFAAHIEVRSETTWDSRERVVSSFRKTMLGAVSLAASPLPRPDPDAVLAAVIAGLQAEGIAALPWTRELRQWQARVMLMRACNVPAPIAWPDLSDETLLTTLADWAPAWLAGIVRHDHFARIDLANALRGRLSYAQAAVLEKQAPTHFTVPSGSRIPIDYLAQTPSVAARLQELFGLNETPSIAAGRIALVLKLLSPAGRPVQVTRDLVSFWNRGYHEVKKELKGRYPKHYWPDDPFTAQATRRARPR